MASEYNYSPHQIDHFIEELKELEVIEIMQKGKNLRGHEISIEEIVREYVERHGSCTSYDRICHLAETNGVVPVEMLDYEKEFPRFKNAKAK